MTQPKIGLLFAVILFQTHAFAQRSFEEFQKDSIALRVIQKHTFYPPSAQTDAESSIVFAKVYFKDDGRIDSVITSNKSAFGIAARDAVWASNGAWSVHTGNHLPILIPFLFIFDEDVSLSRFSLKMKYFAELSNLLHWQKEYFEGCILSKAVFAIDAHPIP